MYRGDDGEMKLAMIGQRGIPSRAGGVEIHVEEIAKRLVKYGCEVDVYCRKGYCLEAGSAYSGINTIFTPYINLKSLEALTHSFFSVVDAIFKHNDIIHFHALGPSVLAFLPRLMGIRVICTVHGLDWQRGKWGRLSKAFLKLGEYATARFANRTISVSRTLVEYYRKKYGKEIEFVGNGININGRQPADLMEKNYGLKENSYLLYLGRLVPEKGVHYLIEAYKRLDTGKKLVIAGGSSHSCRYEKNLHQLAEGNSNIIFTGFIKGMLLEELLCNACIYILPSDVEGMPISLLEAMSYGTLCLVSDIAENRDVVRDYGYTFRHGDVDDLTAKMQTLLDIIPDKGRCGQPPLQYNGEIIPNSRERIIEYINKNFDWDVTSLCTYRIYESLLENGS